MSKVHAWKIRFLGKSGVGIETNRVFATQYPEPHRALEHAMMMYKDDMAYFISFERTATMELV